MIEFNKVMNALADCLENADDIGFYFEEISDKHFLTSEEQDTMRELAETFSKIFLKHLRRDQND